ncbi:MAG: DMT family transporter [Hyphomicrobiaceae bacterium]|nr:DMT family transporter [Hyphomicrobiaceae bacterium]MCC0024048.1 DMT family transporter [Hyphomicrobiaceae bacterium]
MAAEQDRPIAGIALVMLATLSFASADVVTKYLTEIYPVSVVMAVRYVLNVLLVAAFFLPRMGRGLIRTNRTLLVFVRSVSLAAASLTLGLALRFMPVGETVAIIYLAPILIMAIAVPLLGERVVAGQWLWAIAAFAGVLLIVRPGAGLDPFGVVMALVNVGFAVTYHLLSRVLSPTESTAALLFHSAWVGALIFVVLGVGDLSGLSVTPHDFLMMLALGLLMSLGHFFFTSSYRFAPASIIAPANYMHLVWAGGLGLLVFGHLPTTLSLFGMLLVLFGGVAIAILAPRKPRRPIETAE